MDNLKWQRVVESERKAHQILVRFCKHRHYKELDAAQIKMLMRKVKSNMLYERNWEKYYMEIAKWFAENFSKVNHDDASKSTER